MGIENINKAICDVCGKTIYSGDRQSKFLDELKSQGWAGNVNKLKCDKCSGNKFYEGRIDSVRKIGDGYFVKIVNEKAYVYVKYGDLKPTNSNELPNRDALIKYLAGQGKDPEHIKYANVRKVNIGGFNVLIAQHRT